MNESFSSTNESEDSEIAAEITNSFRENDIKVVYVTHFFEYAVRYIDDRQQALFLCPERRENGERTYCLVDTYHKEQAL